MFARTSGAILKLFERFSKALAVFLSLVFCEIIVTMRVLNGSSCDIIHSGILYFFLSVSRIRRARFSSIRSDRLFESDK